MGFKEINIIFRHVYFTAAGVKCRVEAVKRIPVLHRSADYIYTGSGCHILTIRLSTTIILITIPFTLTKPNLERWLKSVTQAAVQI